MGVFSFVLFFVGLVLALRKFLHRPWGVAEELWPVWCLAVLGTGIYWGVAAWWADGLVAGLVALSMFFCVMLVPEWVCGLIKKLVDGCCRVRSKILGPD